MAAARGPGPQHHRQPVRRDVQNRLELAKGRQSVGPKGDGRAAARETHPHPPLPRASHAVSISRSATAATEKAETYRRSTLRNQAGEKLSHKPGG